MTVLTVWAVVLGLHVRREYFKPVAMRLAEGTRSLAPGSDFYVVRMNGHAIGFATSRLDTIPQGFSFDDMLVVDVPAMDTLHRALARTRLTVDRSLRLRTFDFGLQSAVGNFSVKGAAKEGSILELTVGAGGTPQVSRIPMDSSFAMDAGLPMRLAAGGQLMVGREVRLRVFDPSVLASRDVAIRVLANEDLVVPDSAAQDAQGRWQAVRHDTLRTWKIEQRMGSVAVTTWVDEDGKVVRSQSPLGFTLEKTEYELARQEWREGEARGSFASGYGTVIEGTAVSSNADLGELGETKHLRVRLLNVELAGFDLSGGRQRLHGDTLVITQEVVPAHPPGYALPYRAVNDAQMSRQLQAEPLIQANDARIVSLARTIARGSTNPTEVARRLNDWVYSNLEKEITLSVPSALQVLDARKGDCNEHTVLYVALARALGLPTRTAVGLVHVRGKFYYHAWPEVWLDRWVAVDPTLGQFPADASHLRFIIGDLAQQLELVRLIGRLRLEVV